MKRLATILICAVIVVGLFPPARPVDARTSVLPTGQGDGLIRVDIAMTGLKDVRRPWYESWFSEYDTLAEWWEHGAEAIWNDGFSNYRSDCYGFVLDINLLALGKDDPIPDGYHAMKYIPRRLVRPGSPLGSVSGRRTSGQSPYSDYATPYEKSLSGTMTPSGPNVFAHEVGHLMGLGEDYWRDPANLGNPIPGREESIMSTTGSTVDQELVTRLGNLITGTPSGLPDCEDEEDQSDTAGTGSPADDAFAEGFPQFITGTYDVTINGDGTSVLGSTASGHSTESTTWSVQLTNVDESTTGPTTSYILRFEGTGHLRHETKTDWSGTTDIGCAWSESNQYQVVGDFPLSINWFVTFVDGDLVVSEMVFSTSGETDGWMLPVTKSHSESDCEGVGESYRGVMNFSFHAPWIIPLTAYLIDPGVEDPGSGSSRRVMTRVGDTGYVWQRTEPFPPDLTGFMLAYLDSPFCSGACPWGGGETLTIQLSG